MPSDNRDLDLSAQRRLRINKCEGEIAVIYQACDDFGKWETMATINLTAEQAILLQDRLAWSVRR